MKIPYFAKILLQVQDLPKDSDIVVIKEYETETRSEDLEESIIDETDLEPKKDVSYEKQD